MKQNFDNGSLIPKASFVTNRDKEVSEPVSFFENNKKRLVKIAAVILGVLSVSIFGTIAYKSMKYSKLPESVESVPLIKAELSPVKVVPKDPGGELISNQDKLIYSTLENKNVKTKKLSEQSEVKELKEVYSDAKTIRAPAVTETKPKKKAENSEKKDVKSEKVASTKKAENSTVKKETLQQAQKDKNSSEKEAKKTPDKNNNPVEKAEEKHLKVDVLALEKEIDTKPAVSQAKVESKAKEVEVNSKAAKIEAKSTISNPFDLVGDNE